MKSTPPAGLKAQRVILVTGANNGIGLAMVKALLEKGDFVAALDLSCENLSPNLKSPNLRVFPCDITDPDRVLAVVNEVLQDRRRIDVLVNNACLALFKPFLERCSDDIRREFEVNYFGTLNMIRAVLPIMCAQQCGVIHNVSSGVGYTGMPNMTGYTSAKGAIEALTRTLALEFQDEGVIFNIIHPPLTRTKSSSGLGIPPEMMADPDDVGRRLADKIGSKQAFLTPDFSTWLAMVISQHFPIGMGRLTARLAKRAQISSNERS